MAYKLSNAAETDIILAYIEGVDDFGIPQAESYHARLERTFELLSENPRMARERLEISPPVRVHPCGSHVIIYVIEGDDVFIIRVRHQREDWLEDPA